MPGKFFIIESKLNGLVLDIEGSEANPGARVVTWDRNNNPNQLWWQDTVCNVIRSKLDENLVLEMQDDTLVVNNFQPDEYNQKWRVTGETISHLENDTLVLDIADNCEDSGARICSYDYNGGDNQHWSIDYQAPAYCQIVTRNDRHSGKCIDVAMNDEGEVGSRVIIYEKKDQFHRDGNDNQLWYEDKYGIIHSKIKDMVIDTSEGKAHMQMYDPDVTKRQYVYSNGRIVLKGDPNTCLQIKDHEKRKLLKDFKVEEAEYEGHSYQKWLMEYK